MRARSNQTAPFLTCVATFDKNWPRVIYHWSEGWVPFFNIKDVGCFMSLPWTNSSGNSPAAKHFETFLGHPGLLNAGICIVFFRNQFDWIPQSTTSMLLQARMGIVMLRANITKAARTHEDQMPTNLNRKPLANCNPKHHDAGQPDSEGLKARNSFQRGPEMAPTHGTNERLCCRRNTSFGLGALGTPTKKSTN